MEDLENKEPDVTPTKSANELFVERVKSKYPERDYESNPDEVYNASMEGYVAEHEKLKAVMESNKAIGERMMKDPKAAAALAEFMEGKPLPAALRKYFTEKELSMSEGEEGYEEYINAIKEREAKEAESAKMQQEYEQNLEDSKTTVEQFSTEKGMSPEEFDTFIESATDKVIAPLMQGKITAELLEVLHKGMNYDNDLAQTAEVNRIAGKNEKIVETRKTGKTDGLPTAGGGGSAALPEVPTGETANYFGKIADNSASGDIFARGGYKPKK